MSPQQESHGRNLLASVREIPVLLPPPSFGAPTSVTEEDMGKGDPDTINYINIRTNDIPSGHEERIKHIEEIIDLTHRWLDIHSGIQTKIQKDKGTLPTDMSMASQLKRSDYRIKVVDTIMSEGSCGWINLSHQDTTNYKIRVKKAEFHTQLLKDMLAGITTVQGISAKIERVLESIGDIIVRSKDQEQEKSVWSFFNVFTWDDVTQSVKGSIRIIWYRVSGEMVEYTVHKASYKEVQMQFGFHQTEYTFVESLWTSSAKTVRDFLEEYGNKKVRDPIDGEITP
ncbi:hypothetical protein VM1G_07414 [Cytospora mali]|uniref:Uncharacterized protein n=1 Tax=Cytospora mali TaxID=578113 RepID=A0A194W5E6_CYTMA|nr:hypothetical protein VM1G_07414 [Valsa mali]